MKEVSDEVWEIAQDLYEDADFNTNRYGELESFEVKSYEDYNGWDRDCTEADFEEAKKYLEELLDGVKYYTEYNSYKPYLELSDNHTLWKIEVPDGFTGEFNDEEYAVLYNTAIQHLEEEIGTEVFGLGRSGRHICVEDTFRNLTQLDKFKEAQIKWEQWLINTVEEEMKSATNTGEVTESLHNGEKQARCSSCGADVIYTNRDVEHDIDGDYIECPNCHATFDVDYDAIEPLLNKKTETKRIATNIKWDTDGAKIKLPTEIEIPDDIEDEDEISDYITDQTGFCHTGFDIKEETKRIVKVEAEEQPKFNAVEFEKLIPYVMRWKEYDTANNNLYWITQQFFKEEDVKEFAEQFKNTEFNKAYVTVRDLSTYKLEKDMENKVLVVVDKDGSYDMTDYLNTCRNEGYDTVLYESKKVTEAYCYNLKVRNADGNLYDIFFKADIKADSLDAVKDLAQKSDELSVDEKENADFAEKYEILPEFIYDDIVGKLKKKTEAEDMEVVRDDIKTAVKKSDSTKQEKDQVKGSIDVLKTDEESAIAGYKEFNKETDKVVDKELSNEIDNQMQEIVDDEKEHIEKLDTIKSALGESKKQEALLSDEEYNNIANEVIKGNSVKASDMDKFLHDTEDKKIREIKAKYNLDEQEASDLEEAISYYGYLSNEGVFFRTIEDLWDCFTDMEENPIENVTENTKKAFAEYIIEADNIYTSIWDNEAVDRAREFLGESKKLKTEAEDLSYIDSDAKNCKVYYAVNTSGYKSLGLIVNDKDKKFQVVAGQKLRSGSKTAKRSKKQIWDMAKELKANGYEEVRGPSSVAGTVDENKELETEDCTQAGSIQGPTTIFGSSKKKLKTESEDEVEDYGPYYVKEFNESGTDMDTIGFETEQEACRYAEENIKKHPDYEYAVYETATDECLYLYDKSYFEESKKIKVEAEEGIIEEQLNTGLLPIVDVDLYSRYSAEMLNGVPEGEEGRLDEIIQEIAPDFIQETIQTVLPSVQIVPKGVYHPKEYNFSGDELEFVLKASSQEYEALKEQALSSKEFDTFLKDNYKSYDGFMSFMPDNIEDFNRADRWKQVVQVIMFALRNEDLQSVKDQYDEAFNEAVWQEFPDIDDEEDLEESKAIKKEDYEVWQKYYEDGKTTTEYVQSFDSYEKAQKFVDGLNQDPNCEAWIKDKKEEGKKITEEFWEDKQVYNYKGIDIQQTVSDRGTKLYSILNNQKPFSIPDFRTLKAAKKYIDDNNLRSYKEKQEELFNNDININVDAGDIASNNNLDLGGLGALLGMTESKILEKRSKKIGGNN